MNERRYWSALARSLSPYIPGEQPKTQQLIKLNTNENPFPPSPVVAEALRSFNADELRLYPDPESTELRTALAEKFSLTTDQILIGNGSDELLGFAFRAFFDGVERKTLDGKLAATVLTPNPGYSFYPVYANLFTIPLHYVKTQPDFSLNVADFFPEHHDFPVGGIVLANPNAPTGRALSRDDIRTILRANPDVVVIVDEAYVDFSDHTAVPLLGEYPNLLIIHTLSKSRSLAGLRVGYALGAPELILALHAVRDSFNSYTVDRIAQRLALAAIRDDDYFRDCCAEIRRVRTLTETALTERGFTVIPSDTNFIFASYPNRSGAVFLEKLRERKILVRHWAKKTIDPYIRITVGTEEEMQTFIRAVDEIIATF